METTWKKNTHKYFTDPAKRNGYYPLISSYEGELVNLFCSENPLNNKISSISLTQDSIVENEDDYIIESDNKYMKLIWLIYMEYWIRYILLNINFLFLLIDIN